MDILTNTQLDFIKSEFYRNSDNKTLYAITDGIKDSDIYGNLLFSEANHLALIDDSVFGYKPFAPPFLVELSTKPEKFWKSSTDYLISHQLGKHNTIFFQSHLDLKTLYTHLQDYIYPFDTKNRFLRFYDPRFFPKWIRSLNSDEFNELFNLINCFWCEEQEVEKIIQFSLSDDKKNHQEHTLSYNKESITEDKNGLSNE